MFSAQIMNGHVGIDLGPIQVFVPEQLSNAANTNAAIQQVRGKAMPERVGMDAFETGTLGQSAHDRVNSSSRDAAAANRQEDRTLIATVQIRTKSLVRVRSKKSNAVPVALALPNQDRTCFEIQVV